MATVQHSALTSAELHEPKGVATANANTVYVADGVGSGQWRQAPTGFCTYASSGTGTTITTPQTFTLVNVPSQQYGSQRQYSHNGAGRLTYTGATTLSTKINATLTLETKSTNVDVVAQIFINGSPALPAQFIAEHTASGTNDIVTLPLLGYVDLQTNDYVEIYVQASSGNVEVFGLNLLAEGVL